jgi:hypothetical protein
MLGLFYMLSVCNVEVPPTYQNIKIPKDQHTKMEKQKCWKTHLLHSINVLVNTDRKTPILLLLCRLTQTLIDALFASMGSSF